MSSTSIGTGTVVQIGGRTIISGSASGIDTSALVEAAYQARLSEARKLADKVDINNNKGSAYAQLQDMLLNVQSSLTNLKRVYGSSTTNNSVFNKKAGTLASSTATDPSTLLAVGVNAGAVKGDYEIEIVSKATAQKVRGTDVASNTAALGYTGTFDIQLSGGTAASINVTAGMTLQQLAAAINTQSTTSRVAASVVKVSDTAYQLVLTGLDTAQDIQITSTGGDDVMNLLGVTDGVGGFNNEVQASGQAELVIDGITIFRNTNSFSDAISGVQFNILKAEPGNTMTLSVTEDYSSVKTGILDFVDAYNELRDFVIQNQTLVDGVASEDAFLYKDQQLSSLNLELQTILSGTFTNSAGFTNLRNIGFTFTATNKIALQDEAKLDSAIIDNFDSVKALFETQFSSDNAQFNIVANTSRTKSLNIAMDITHDGSSITSVSVGGDANLFDIVGNLIRGKTGTVYEGLSFAYIGTTSTTVNLTVEQGIADLVSGVTKRYGDELTGSIQKAINSLAQDNERMEARADSVRERAEAYRDRLIEKYAKFEEQLAASKALLAQLRAILGTDKRDDR
ncbi:MAG: flagellar filament capping protein FliD [Alphaproteobacteria bacterium]|nr:flagellar filament capping protein FliD [Alphaproteobacteria bacterium]